MQEMASLILRQILLQQSDQSRYAMNKFALHFSKKIMLHNNQTHNEEFIQSSFNKKFKI